MPKSSDFIASIQLSTYLVKQARLLSGLDDDEQAVSYLLANYSRLVAENRKLSSRLNSFDVEALEFDDKLAKLQHLARQILEL